MSEKSASFKKEKGMLNTTIVKKKLNVIILIMNELKIIFRLEKIDLREFYEQTFGQAVKDYNEKQTREDRKIGSYYDKISADSKKNLFYEIVIQIGDMHDTNCADNPEKR